MNVLVTGAGGPAGVAVIRALRGRGCRVVAVDADPLAAGIRLADAGAVVPSFDTPGYVEALCDIALTSRSTVLVPTLSEEIAVLHGGRGTLDAVGLRTWLPDPGAVRRCVDKWAFAEAMHAAAIPSPPTGRGTEDGVPGPWIVKPRFGRGSRDVYAIDEFGELPWAMRRVREPIVQQRVHGREFTVDALVAPDGSLAGAVPRWRIETRGGISTKGVTFTDPGLRLLVERTLDAVGLTGPANVQGFAHDGGFTIVEVNPRFSGGLPLSLAAGADLVGEYLRGIAGLGLRRASLAFRPDVTMIRHFDEVFEG